MIFQNFRKERGFAKLFRFINQLLSKFKRLLRKENFHQYLDSFSFFRLALISITLYI